MKIYLIVEDFKGNKRVVSYSGDTTFNDRKMAEACASSLLNIYEYLGVSYYVKEVEL